MFRAGQPNFSRGEIGPELHGRFDVDSYAAGVERARNVIVLKYGGLVKRPGTRLVAEVIDSSDPIRLIPFQFSLTQTYALEMGQGYMSPCAEGGRILEEELAITSITNAANAQVTAAFHGYTAGASLIYITGVAGAMGDYLNNRAWGVISVVNASNFTIDANTTALAAFSAATGGITRVGAPTPPPPPPPVPPPPPPPTPPSTGGGGGGGLDYR